MILNCKGYIPNYTAYEFELLPLLVSIQYLCGKMGQINSLYEQNWINNPFWQSSKLQKDWNKPPGHWDVEWSLHYRDFIFFHGVGNGKFVCLLNTKQAPLISRNVYIINKSLTLLWPIRERASIIWARLGGPEMLILLMWFWGWRVWWKNAYGHDMNSCPPENGF